MNKANEWMENQLSFTDEPETIYASETVSAPVMPEPKFGVVVDCVRLNVRMKPRTDADIICVIDCNSKVTIDDENSTKNFYKICTEFGAEGYCMKQFIKTLN